jgi:hypothetical protein
LTGVCRRIEQRFRARPESVRAVRRFLASTLGAWGGRERDPATQAILLVASELSTNSVEATDEDFCVTMTVHRQYAEIAVEDRAPRAARLVPAGADECSGRGLAIVAAVSSNWGQDPYDGAHKKVWSRVALPPDSPLPGDCRL